MLVTSVTVLLIGYVVRQGKAVHAVHAQRERLLAREREVSARVTNILESITDAFFAVDRTWRFTYVNREAERLLHRSREELLGRVLWKEFPEAVGATFQKKYQEAMARQKPVQFEEHYPPLDAWFDVRAYPAAEGLSVYFHDVTARRLAEEKIRESEQRFRALAENATMAIFVIDEASTIEFANPAVERIFGYAGPEMIGRSIGMLMPEEQRPLHDAGMRQYLHSGRRNISWEGIELPGLTKEGRVVPLEISMGEFVREGRHYFTGIARDISKRKRNEAALRDSEERYRLLADMIPQHIWTTEASGYHSYFSRRWYEYTGAEPEQTQGEGWLDWLHPDDRERTIARWQHSLRAGVPYAIEYRFRSASGNYRWFLGQAMPLRNEAGEIVRWFGTLTDITERKQVEEAMRESEERFRALANSLPQLAWIADPTGWIFWYNERWHEYTGTTLEEMQGWGWRKVHHPEHVDRVVEKIRHAFEAGERWEDTFPLRSRAGEYRWFLSRALPIRDATGTLVRWVGTNTDITEQIEAAAERERLLGKEQEARAEADRRRVELERVTESRSRLMRGFSHDVRNPLGVADAQAWALEDGRLLGALNEKQRESVQRVRRSIRVSLGLIDDLLELARSEAGQIDLNDVETDIGQLVRDAAGDFQAHAMSAGFALNVRAPERLQARTDPVRVRQVLANLLSNAVKYAPQGQVTVDAAIRQAGGPRPGEWIAVSVVDNGPGIPADMREQIFREFTRLDPQAQQGAGIGLAISRRIAQLLGGDLTVQSEVGRGSEFTLWLPAGAAARS